MMGVRTYAVPTYFKNIRGTTVLQDGTLEVVDYSKNSKVL